MKIDRQAELNRLSNNLRLTLNDNGEKYLALTTDASKCDIVAFVREFAPILAKSCKVAVATYDDIEPIEGVDIISVDIEKDDKDSIDAKTAEYDIVLVICPNMISSNVYLHVADYVSDIVFVAKKWHSKTNNINYIKSLAEAKDMSVIGLIYAI